MVARVRRPARPLCRCGSCPTDTFNLNAVGLCSAIPLDVTVKRTDAMAPSYPPVPKVRSRAGCRRHFVYVLSPPD